MSFTFGSNTGTKPSGFGGFAATTSAAPSTGFSFGGVSAAPATGFGATNPPAFGFGGTATSTPAQNFGFGATSTAASSTPAFGGFGSTTTTSSAPTFGFGTPATSASTSFGFGAPISSAPAPSFGNFGAPASTGGSLFGNLGTTSTATTTQAFGFGGNAVTSAAPSAFGFGAPASTASQPPAFGFGGTTSLPGSTGFGTTAPPAFGIGGGSAFGGTSIAASTPFSTGFATSTTAFAGGFGAPSTSTAFGAPTTSTAFGAQTTSSGLPTFGSTISGTPQTSTGVTFGLGGQPAPAFQLGTAASSLSTSAVTTSTSTGLGGTLFPPAGSGSTPAASEAKTDAKALKEMSVPNELFQTVEELKKYVKDEKSISSDIVHMSPKVHEKITSQTEGLKRLVSVLASELSKQKQQLEKLKKEITEGLLNAEIAQRTKDAPPGLQFENVAPQEYFLRLVGNFEHQMVNFRRQIEETERHLHSMSSHPGVTPQHLMDAIRKQHEAFVSLAAKYQPLNEAVKQEKEIFSSLHRQSHGSNPDFFVHHQPITKSSSSVPTTVGPSPFNGQMDGFALARASMATRPPNQTLSGAGPPTLGLGNASNTLGAPTPGPFGTNSMFPNTTNTSLGQSSFLQSGFNSTGLGNTSTPGIFGSTISPFGNNNNNQSTSLFQSSGKRGKH